MNLAVLRTSLDNNDTIKVTILLPCMVALLVNSMNIYYINIQFCFIWQYLLVFKSKISIYISCSSSHNVDFVIIVHFKQFNVRSGCVNFGKKVTLIYLCFQICRSTHSRKHVLLFIQALCSMRLCGFGQMLILNTKILFWRKSPPTFQFWRILHLQSWWETEIFLMGMQILPLCLSLAIFADLNQFFFFFLEFILEEKHCILFLSLKHVFWGWLVWIWT